MASTVDQPVPRSTWHALYALCIGLFLTLMDQSLVAVALPQIGAELGADINQQVWVSAVYLLAFAVPLLVTGRLGDRFGQRNVYVVGMAIFTISAALCALAPTIEILIALRALQGFGGSLINPQPLAIITRIFPRYQRGAAMGIWSAVASSATLIAPLIGGFVVGAVGWRWVFALYVPFGLIALVMVWVKVPRLSTSSSRIDLLSAGLSLVAVLLVIAGIQEGPKYNWNTWIWVMIIAGVLALLLFLRRQKALGTTNALMPVELFNIANFRLGILSVFSLGFAVYSVTLPVMIYLQDGLGLSPQTAGIVLAPMGLLSIFIAPIAGRLTDRLAPGVISKTGFSSLITSMALFSVFMHLELSAWWLLIPILLLGVANALAWSPNSAITLRDVPSHLSGAASGVYNTSRQVGAVAGAAALGAVMQMGEGVLSVGTSVGNAMAVPIVMLVAGLIAVSRFRPEKPRVVEL